MTTIVCSLGCYSFKEPFQILIKGLFCIKRVDKTVGNQREGHCEKKQKRPSKRHQHPSKRKQKFFESYTVGIYRKIQLEEPHQWSHVFKEQQTERKCVTKPEGDDHQHVEALDVAD